MAKLDLDDTVTKKNNGKGFGVVVEIVDHDIANIKWSNGKRSLLHWNELLKVTCAGRAPRNTRDGWNVTNSGRRYRKAWDMSTEEYDGVA